MTAVDIVSTGVANLASVIAAFERLSVDTRVVEKPEEIESAEYLVLPGVGTFGAAMSAIKQKQLAAPLTARITAGKPTLAICLGMQILFAASDETPNMDGLNIIPQRVQRIAADLPVPQMGWNTISGFANGYAYFANSFAVAADTIPEWEIASFDYGSRYIAAIKNRGVLACQFHPELSGAWGQELIKGWLEASC